MDTVEKKLETYAKKNPHIQRVMTIPGVGRKTAEALVAAIDDLHRFKSASDLDITRLRCRPKECGRQPASTGSNRIESTERNDEATPSTGPAPTRAKASTPRIVV
ncbi:MAG: transposase [Rubripirellula sp.]